MRKTSTALEGGAAAARFGRLVTFVEDVEQAPIPHSIHFLVATHIARKVAYVFGVGHMQQEQDERE